MLSWFEKEGDALIGEVELRQLSDEDASRILDFDFKEGLGAEFPLDDRRANLLSAVTNEQIDIERWDYFLGACSQPG